MAKKELSTEVRVLLAFAISFVILIASQRLLVNPTPPAQEAASEPAPSAVVAAEQPAEITPTPGLPTEPVQGSSEQEITVEGNLYKVTFSTRGAVVKSWELRDYKDVVGNPLELVNPEATRQHGFPLSLWVAEEPLRREINSGIYVASKKGDLVAPVTLTFDYSSGETIVRKQFSFTPDSYVAEVKTEVVRNGQLLAHGIAWPAEFGDAHDIMQGNLQASVFYRGPESIERLKPGSDDGAQAEASGNFPFAGIEDRFFSATVLAQEGGLRVTAYRQIMQLPEEKTRPSLGVVVGIENAAKNDLRLFVGPKALDVLAAVDTRLPEIVDYGWFSFVAKPMFLALQWIHSHVVGNYGWAIILLTIAINFIMFPLKIKSLRSTMKMQKIQPLIKAIQEKYKHLKVSDPRRQEMTKETMGLYKKHGVNPVGGCLPVLLQMPFLFGFYKVLVVSIEMRNAHWMWWISDLSAPEDLPVKILPLLMCGTQFTLQKMSPMPMPDPRQQKIMMMMPFMMVFFFWNLSSGLVLYWLTGNLMGIVQQVYINRTEMKHIIEERQKTKSGKKKIAQRKD